MDEKLLRIDNRQVHYWEAGTKQGRVVILLHGGVGDARSHWGEVVPALSESFHVYAPDLPAFGSSAPLDERSLTGYADWLKLFMDAHQIEQAVIVGSSLGATITRVFASQYPTSTPAIVLVNGGEMFRPTNLTRVLLALPLVGGLVTRVMARTMISRDNLGRMFYDKERLSDDLVHAAHHNLGGTARALLAHFLSLREQATPLVPVTLLYGNRDATFSADEARSLARSIPNTQLVEICDCGHFPHLEVPDVFVFQVTRFLDRMSHVPSELPGAGMLPSLP